MNLSISVKLFILIGALVLLGCILCSCSSTTPVSTPSPVPTNTQVTPTPQPSGANVVEVVYFHRAQRCYGCRHAEDTTHYTIETYFSEELANGKLVFKVFNVQDPANSAIATKYGAYTSSLFMNDIEEGIDHIEEITDIWFLLYNDEEFVNLVKGEIEMRLGE